MKANQSKDLFRWTRMAMALCAIALVGTLLVSCKATVSPSSFPQISGESVLNPGDIAFTGICYNGNSQFSFVPTTNLNGGVSIFFTNYSYDPNNSSSPFAPLVDESTTSTSTSNYPGMGAVAWQANMATTITEGTIAYITPSSGLAAYTPVIISNTKNAPNVLQGGTVVNINGDNDIFLVLNHNGAGHKILAYNVVGASNVYVAAIIFGPDSWTTSGSIAQGAFWDSYLPSNLTVGVNAVDLSSLWNGGGQDGNLATYNNATQQNDNAVLNTCQSTLSGMVNAGNWQADANEAKGSVALNGTGLTACVTGTGYTGLIP